MQSGLPRNEGDGDVAKDDDGARGRGLARRGHGDLDRGLGAGTWWRRSWRWSWRRSWLSRRRAPWRRWFSSRRRLPRVSRRWISSRRVPAPTFLCRPALFLRRHQRLLRAPAGADPLGTASQARQSLLLICRRIADTTAPPPLRRSGPLASGLEFMRNLLKKRRIDFAGNITGCRDLNLHISYTR